MTDKTWTRNISRCWQKTVKPCIVKLAHKFSTEFLQEGYTIYRNNVVKGIWVHAISPADCSQSFQLSSVLRTPARMVWYSSFRCQPLLYWSSSGKAAAHNPWCAWWGEGGDRVSVQWQCLRAWWSEERQKKSHRNLKALSTYCRTNKWLSDWEFFFLIWHARKKTKLYMIILNVC